MVCDAVAKSGFACCMADWPAVGEMSDDVTVVMKWSVDVGSKAMTDYSGEHMII